MFKQISKILATSLIATATFSANAQLTESSQITTITPGSSSIRVEGPTGNPGNCGRQGLYVLTFDNPRNRELYAGLLTAKASGADVRLFVSGCIQDGAQNLAEIRSIIIQ